MKPRTLLLIGLAVLAVGVIAAVALYNMVLGPTLAASGPITAVPLALATTAPAATDAPAATAPAATAPAATAAPAATEAPAATDAPATSAGPRVFVIDQAASEVRFIIFEELRGQPVDVVGASNQVAGEIAVDLADLSTAQVGVIQINARTLVTDSDRRNQAIRNQILNTDAYELITFTPTAITGLSGAGAAGQGYTFQLSGDLTIRDQTQPVTFEVTVQAASEAQLTGTAKATIKRGDFGLNIPSVPFVANVAEDVRLEFDFVANAK